MIVAADVSAGRIAMFCHAARKIVGQAFSPGDSKFGKRRACLTMLPSENGGSDGSERASAIEQIEISQQCDGKE
jgi:hypothetical protein